MKIKRTKWDKKRELQHQAKAELRRRTEAVIFEKLMQLSPADRERVVKGELPLFDMTHRKA